MQMQPSQPHQVNSFKQPVTTSANPKLDPNTKKDAIYIPKSMPSSIPKSQVLFLNAIDKSNKTRMSQEEFLKIQAKIKSILKVRENNFGITNMSTTSVGGILIAFSSIEMANKLKAFLKAHCHPRISYGHLKFISQVHSVTGLYKC